MKAFLLAVAVSGSLAGPLAAQDWAGFYGGFSGNYAIGEYDEADPMAPTVELDGAQVGLFVGYNVQRGNLVFGGELAYSLGDVVIKDFSAGKFDSFFDLKGRLGYAQGDAHFYGILGYSWSRFSLFDEFSSDGDGLVFGLGAEASVSDRVMVGVELMRRSVGHDGTPSLPPFNADVDTVTLRVGMTF
jgi:outer membrane immunogenic protein